MLTSYYIYSIWIGEFCGSKRISKAQIFGTGMEIELYCDSLAAICAADNYKAIYVQLHILFMCIYGFN